jgi:23S rRNA pseudouridine1911/1915/1917 synthase
MVAEAKETLQEIHQVTAAEADAGERLDRLLAARLDGLSRSRLKGLIEHGQVSTAGIPVKEPSTRVKAGQTFAIVIPEATPAIPEGQALALDIVYEDADIIVIDKPAGMVVHPAPGNPDKTLVNALIAHCGASLAGIGGVRRPGIVHRLDKDTSGLIVAAKSDAAHQGLVAQFAGRSIERVYAAVVWGRPEPAAGEIAGNIGRNPRNRKKMAVLKRGGRPAMTRYRIERSFAGGAASLVACRLMTGRTHQIRVHLAERGHPLIGDPLYGRRRGQRLTRLPEAGRHAVSAMARQALHARTLAFRHPITADSLAFESNLPPDIKGLIYSLEAL